MPYNPQSSPYGDIYRIGTTAADTISQRLYAEQKQHEADRRKALGDLDNEFAKNVAGVRNPDIGELTTAYADYKTAAKDQIKRGNLTPQEQMAVLQKKAKVYDVISKSKAQKEKEVLEAKQLAAKPIGYTKDAHGGLIKIMNTPVSQLGETDDPFESIRYTGNMSDFNKLLADANGKPIAMSDEVVDNKDLRRKDITKVNRLNNPIEYFNAVRTGLVGSQKTDDFVRTFGNITPEQMQQTELQYNQVMSNPVMRKRLGMENQDLPPVEGLSEPEKVARYMAQLHTLSPLVVTTKEGSPIYDKVALEKDKNAEWDRRQAINDKYIKGRIFLNNSLHGAPSYENVGFPTKEVADAVGEDVVVPSTITGGAPQTQRVIWADMVDPGTLDLITDKNVSQKKFGVAPIDVPLPNGTTRKAYIHDPQTNDWIGKDNQRIYAGRVKDDYIKTYAPTKYKATVGTKAQIPSDKKLTPAEKMRQAANK